MDQRLGWINRAHRTELALHRYLRCASLVVVVGLAPLLEARQHGLDRYTRYELIDPAAGTFRVTDDVSAPASATFVVTASRGLTLSDITVLDRFTGTAVPHVAADGRITVTRLRQAEPSGEIRLRVQYLARSQATLGMVGADAVFTLTPESKRHAVVLPAGYELLDSHSPAQVIEEADGRLNVSSWNTMPVSVPLRIRLRKRPARAAPQEASTSPVVISPGTAATSASNVLAGIRVSERAIQDREIVYFLQQPDTHSFRLYHDYTETRPGVATYRNVVRGGSTVSDPSAMLLDTGAALRVESLKEADAEVVIIHFPAVEPGRSSRLRITETYTDPGRYGLANGQLVWNRNFGRPVNDVVLPAGWYVTDSSIPAVVTEETDGRIRLAFTNPRPDSIDVAIKARRR